MSDRLAGSKPATAGAEPDRAQWLDVTGQGEILPRDRLAPHAQLGDAPVPGGRVDHRDPGRADAFATCTVGPAVQGARRGFLIAGHCADRDEMIDQFLVPAQGSAWMIGHAVEVRVDPAANIDSAVVWTQEVPDSAARIAGTWPVAGVMPVADLQLLPAGVPVCFDGTISGVVCGPLRRADRDGGMVQFDRAMDRADAGAAVFLVDQGHRATLIGILKGYGGATSVATPLAPTLQRLHAQALTLG